MNSFFAGYAEPGLFLLIITGAWVSLAIGFLIWLVIHEIRNYIRLLPSKPKRRKKTQKGFHWWANF